MIHNRSSIQPPAHERSGAASAGATAAQALSPSSGTQAANPLNGVSRALGAKLGELAQTRLLPSNEMPAIQDKYASLFVIPSDPDATPLMNNIAKYVNTILAAKEHVSTMSDDVPAKGELAALLANHEDTFVQLNDVATLQRFSDVARDDIDRKWAANY